MLDDVAIAALYHLLNAPKEHMGALYKQGEGYQFTNTVDGGDSHVRGKLSVPPGSLAGLFHNHPGGKSSEDFSEDDKAQARRLGIPSYIQTPSNKVKRFDPHTNITEEVLGEFPIEELKKMIALHITQSNYHPDLKRRLLQSLYMPSEESAPL